MAAGLAALEHYDATAVARLNGLGERLRSDVAEDIRRRNLPAQVTGTGSLFRLHLKTDRICDFRTAQPSVAQKSALARVHMEMVRQGLLLAPNCSGALSTPMGDTDIHDLAAALVDAIQHAWEQSTWE